MGDRQEKNSQIAPKAVENSLLIQAEEKHSRLAHRL